MISFVTEEAKLANSEYVYFQVIITKDNWNFLVRLGKWIRNATLGKNDNGTIESRSEP